MERKTKKEREKLVLLILKDPIDSEICQEYVIKTSLDEEVITDKITEIVRKWEDEDGDYDWTYDEIIEALEKEKLIKIVPFEKYEILI